jgi:NAD(P)-dependent dehydrogenase (short-subunit alcohol dehydrogenase family)
MTALAGKVALVTGAGTRGEAVGTGQATAIVFAREGASVVLMDLDQRAADATAETISGQGGSCAVVVGDVTRDADCARAVATAVDTWGRLDVLHNNVGVSSVGTVVDVAEDE